jgi:hypothetical protein
MTPDGWAVLLAEVQVFDLPQRHWPVPGFIVKGRVGFPALAQRSGFLEDLQVLAQSLRAQPGLQAEDLLERVQSLRQPVPGRAGKSWPRRNHSSWIWLISSTLS